MNLLEELKKEMESHFQKTMDAEGWTMKDIPWCTLDVWNEFLETVGSENVRIISGSRMQRKTDQGIMVDCVRASAMISPQGMERLLDAFNESQSEA